MTDTKLIDTFQKARSDQTLAIVEGVQALKHAARFYAEFTHIISADIEGLASLLEELAPDVKKLVIDSSQEVSESSFAKLSKQPHRTKVMAIAKRKEWQETDFSVEKPIIFLEEPKDLENIGAVIRVSAAADASAVVINGGIDIWHPASEKKQAGYLNTREWFYCNADKKSVPAS